MFSFDITGTVWSRPCRWAIRVPSKILPPLKRQQVAVAAAARCAWSCASVRSASKWIRRTTRVCATIWWTSGSTGISARSTSRSYRRRSGPMWCKHCCGSLLLRIGSWRFSSRIWSPKSIGKGCIFDVHNIQILRNTTIKIETIRNMHALYNSLFDIILFQVLLPWYFAI